VGVLSSGGLDSCVLVAHLLAQGRRVQPFYVRCGVVWQEAEIQALQRFLRAVGSPRLEPLVTFDIPLEDVYQRHWSMTGRDPPDLASPDDAVFLPARNALLLVKPAAWCRLHGVRELALGVLASNPFADATPQFFSHLEAVVNSGPGTELCFLRPLAHLDKRQVMELGRDFPLELTFSCIAPVAGLHCGACNKCAERHTAFAALGIDDPTRYRNPMARTMRGD
jgi:7-cyano-7-deazaguanine synthase